MDLLVAWVVFPLVLLLVTGGIGLLIDWLAARELPGVLIVPVGLAGLIVVAQLGTLSGTTAPATPAAVAVLALVGIALGRDRLRGAAVDRAALAVAAGTFAVFAAPVVLSGQATFAGYGVLGDTAIQFIGADRLLDAGRTLDGLAPSSFQLALQSYFDSGYPFGAQVGLGAVRGLVAQDVAWVYQPYLAYIVAALALALYALCRPLLRSRWTAAAISLIAAQPALVFAYALQGSIKELATASIAALLPALAAALVGAARARSAHGVRAVVPLAVGTAAGFAAIGPAAATWALPVLLVALAALLAVRLPGRLVIGQVLLFVAVAAALSLPTIAALRGYVNVTTTVVTAKDEIGNLAGALDPFQVVGIWLSRDYRFRPHLGGPFSPGAITWALIALAIASAAFAVACAARRRAWPLLLYVGVSALACVVVVRAGSPWASAKALMIASPAALLMAMLGAPAVAQSARRMRPVALLLGLAIAGGVLTSNALAFRAASLAPRERLEELERLGQREAGRGPALYTEFEEYGKHFLRAADPTGVSEAFSPRRDEAAAEGGRGIHFGYATDLDDVAKPYVTRHRTLIVRRSPVASRPPAGYRLVSRGAWYETWRRVADAPEILAHLALGSELSPAASPRCGDVARLARQARRDGAVLAAVERSVPPVFEPTRAVERPAQWHPDGQAPLTLVTSGPGRVAGELRVRKGGRFVPWLGGSFGRPMEVRIDGRVVGRADGGLNPRGEYEQVGEAIELTAGRHEVEIVRAGPSLGPGQGAARRLGPLVLARPRDERAEVRAIEPDRWRVLCGRTLDWIEVVRPPAR